MLSNFLYQLINVLFEVYTILVIVRVFLSWIPHDRSLFVFSFIYDVTEPLLGFFRRLIPMRGGLPLDFSPIIAILALQLLRSFVLRLFF